MPELFVEGTNLSSLNECSTLVENQFAIDVLVYFGTISSFPLVYMSILKPVLHCSDYCNFAVSFEIRSCESSNFGLFKDFFGYFGTLVVPCEFGYRVFSFLKKKAVGMLIEIVLNL